MLVTGGSADVWIPFCRLELPRAWAAAVPCLFLCLLAAASAVREVVEVVKPAPLPAPRPRPCRALLVVRGVHRLGPPQVPAAVPRPNRAGGQPPWKQQRGWAPGLRAPCGASARSPAVHHIPHAAPPSAAGVHLPRGRQDLHRRPLLVAAQAVSLRAFSFPAVAAPCSGRQYAQASTAKHVQPMAAPPAGPEACPRTLTQVPHSARLRRGRPRPRRLCSGGSHLEGAGGRPGSAGGRVSPRGRRWLRSSASEGQGRLQGAHPRAFTLSLALTATGVRFGGARLGGGCIARGCCGCGSEGGGLCAAGERQD